MVADRQADSQAVQNRYVLRNRYVFRGKLVMQTALHIGGGRVTLSHSDSPVVLTPDQKPFIPGSSFKGALRSTVEKMIPNLPGFSTCALIELDEDALKEARRGGQKICPTVRQGEITAKRRANPERAEEILQQAINDLCDTCLLFGSPFAAARLNVNDLYISSEEWSGIIQTRDGVAIDRDTEKARDRLKYDFEVVPAGATFDLEIVLENAGPKDVQLVCVGLSEFVHGFGVVGGKRSRGLGVSKLEELKVSILDLEVDEATKRRRMRDYLVKGLFSDEANGPQFLARQIERIFE
ncbi:MAG: CRISPR-associated RAMP protein [Ktedonobacteraceae bacterium]|nr:CRISPR-associated RAMP protein [Ktedonobacteraceae bacterium]